MNNGPLRTIDGINVYDDINAAKNSGAVLSTDPLHRAIASIPCSYSGGGSMPYGARQDDLEKFIGREYDAMVEVAVKNGRQLAQDHGAVNGHPTFPPVGQLIIPPCGLVIDVRQRRAFASASASGLGSLFPAAGAVGAVWND